MKKYRAILAYNVSCYANVEFEAENKTEALRSCKRMLLDGEGGATFDPDWSSADDDRVVLLEAFSGREQTWELADECVYSDDIRDPPAYLGDGI